MYQLRTFGRLSLEEDGSDSPALLNQRKALALLAVVAAAGRAGISRERLMLLLWSESDATRARGSLKQLLHLIRRQLANDDVLTGPSELRLNRALIDDDVGRFRDAIASGDDAAAVTVYEGAFLDGVYLDDEGEFERWCSAERANLARQHDEALERLATSVSRRGQTEESLVWWRRLQATDPLNARLAVGFMRALHAAGDRAGALRHARSYQQLLQDELGAPPDSRVAEFAEQLLAEAPGSEQAMATRDAEVLALVADTPAAQQTSRVPVSTPTSVPGEFDSPREGLRRHGGVLAGMLITIGLAVGIVVVRSRERQRDDTTLQVGRVAVAILVNRTGNPALDPVGLMASDWVTRGLSRLPMVDVFDIGGLYLRGKTAEGFAADPRALARANGASLVVAGNYYLAGDSITFSAQVLDARTGRVERVLDPVSSLAKEPIAGLDELRQRVTSALGTLLDTRVAAVSSPAHVPPRYEAYLEFAKGQEVYWRGDWQAALPFFRKAFVADSNFFTALSYIAVTGVGTGRCDLVDSVGTAMRLRGDRIPELDLLSVQIAHARCESDHAEHNRLQRRRAAMMPGSKFVQLTMSTGFRQLNLAAEAQTMLKGIEASRDLGWMSEGGRSFFLREVAANLHALGDYTGERAAAARMSAAGGSQLAIGLFAARSLAESGRGDSALRILEALKTATNDPALLSGITGGRLNAVHLATPGWVMWQTALELARTGNHSAADSANNLATQWFTSKGDWKTRPVEQQWLLAQCLMLSARLAEARAIADALVASHPAFVEFRGLLGVVAARQRDVVAVRNTVRWLTDVKNVYPPGAPMLFRAEIAAVLGDTAQAMNLIEALPHGVHPYDWLQFHIEPAFSSLFAMPRFQRFLIPKG